MKERIRNRFRTLASFAGPSGSEFDVIRYCRDELKQWADSVEVLPNGSIGAVFKSSRPGPAMMIDSHADEIGVLIRYITPSGFLLFEPLGGISAKTLMARRMIVRGTHGCVPGVVGMTPGHIQTAAEAASLPDLGKCYIDVGARSAAEVAEMGIEIGSVAVFDSPVVEMHNRDLLTGRCIDDRIGCAVLLEMAKALPNLDFCGTVIVSISTMEEIALVGAYQSSVHFRPDYFVALDTIPAGGTPDVPESRLPVSIGKGPVLSVADAGRSICHMPNKGLLRHIRAVAAAEQLPLQVVSMFGHCYSNNSDSVDRYGSHCPAVPLAIPRRYSHSPIELVDLNDCVAAFDLLKALILRNDRVKFDFLPEA